MEIPGFCPTAMILGGLLEAVLNLKEVLLEGVSGYHFGVIKLLEMRNQSSASVTSDESFIVVSNHTVFCFAPAVNPENPIIL